MRIFVLDNYDSFTWNLVQAFQAQGARVRVERNDRITLAEIEEWRPEAVVISPGPGTPAESGVSAAVMARYRGRVPVLGVCLGHQVLAEQVGGRVVPSGRPVHGKRSAIRHCGIGIFAELPNPFEAARYHSLVVDAATLPETAVPLAWSEDGHLMAFGIAGEPTWGVQFHPESFMTPRGNRLLAAVLEGRICCRRGDVDQRAVAASERRPSEAGGNR